MKKWNNSVYEYSYTRNCIILHEKHKKWSLKMVPALLSSTWSFFVFCLETSNTERNTLQSVVNFCFWHIRNRNGHTNNVKKVWFHIPFIWDTRLDLGFPQCSRVLHDVWKYKYCSVKGKLGLTKSDYVDSLDPYFWTIK